MFFSNFKRTRTLSRAGLATAAAPVLALTLALGVTPAAHAATLTASDGAADDEFGFSVSGSGTTGLVGAQYDDVGANTDQGSAYVFRNLDTASGTVNQNVKLTASDGVAGDLFGWSVSQSGTTGLVGAFADDDAGSFSGSAYVFRNLDAATGTVNENAKLTALDAAAGDHFGRSVSLSGTTGLVGAYQDDDAGSASGSAYLFRNLDAATGTVNENVKLTASDAAAGDRFGQSVSLSGTTGLVGAFTDDVGSNTSQGSAYLFRNLDTAIGTINEDVKLTASDGAAVDNFGTSVSLSNTTGLVGAHRDDDAGSDSGSAYFFRNLDTASGTVNENAKLTASDAAAGDVFGFSVSQSGTTGLVGAFRDDDAGSDSGSAYVFRDLDTATGTVNENIKLTASDGVAGDGFGYSVSLPGDDFIIGALGKNSDTGQAYTGSVSSVTTLDDGSASRTIDGISFISQDDWIIGQNTDDNEVTLLAGNTGDVTAPGKSVHVGQNAGSDSNTLNIEGTLTANEVYVGAAGNTGNELIVDGLIDGGGTVTIASGSTLSGTGAITGNVNNAGTVFTDMLDINGILTNTGTLDGNITVASGSTLSSTGTIDGDVIVDVGATLSGTDTIIGNVTNAGTVAPGNSPGILLIDGNLASTNTIAFELDGLTVGSDYDQLNVTGTADLAGTLDILLGFTPTDGDSFQIMTFGSLTDNGYSFDFSNAALNPGLVWDTSNFASSGIIAVAIIPEPTTAALLGLGSLLMLRRRRVL